jgi:hypothetical protein
MYFRIHFQSRSSIISSSSHLSKKSPEFQNTTHRKNSSKSFHLFQTIFSMGAGCSYHEDPSMRDSLEITEREWNDFLERFKKIENAEIVPLRHWPLSDGVPNVPSSSGITCKISGESLLHELFQGLTKEGGLLSLPITERTGYHVRTAVLPFLNKKSFSLSMDLYSVCHSKELKSNRRPVIVGGENFPWFTVETETCTHDSEACVDSDKHKVESLRICCNQSGAHYRCFEKSGIRAEIVPFRWSHLVVSVDLTGECEDEYVVRVAMDGRELDVIKFCSFRPEDIEQETEQMFCFTCPLTDTSFQGSVRNLCVYPTAGRVAADTMAQLRMMSSFTTPNSRRRRGRYNVHKQANISERVGFLRSDGRYAVLHHIPLNSILISGRCGHSGQYRGKMVNKWSCCDSPDPDSVGCGLHHTGAYIEKERCYNCCGKLSEGCERGLVSHHPGKFGKWENFNYTIEEYWTCCRKKKQSGSGCQPGPHPDPFGVRQRRRELRAQGGVGVSGQGYISERSSSMNDSSIFLDSPSMDGKVSVNSWAESDYSIVDPQQVTPKIASGNSVRFADDDNDDDSVKLDFDDNNRKEDPTTPPSSKMQPQLTQTTVAGHASIDGENSDAKINNGNAASSTEDSGKTPSRIGSIFLQFFRPKDSTGSGGGGGSSSPARGSDKYSSKRYREDKKDIDGEEEEEGDDGEEQQQVEEEEEGDDEEDRANTADCVIS